MGRKHNTHDKKCKIVIDINNEKDEESKAKEEFYGQIAEGVFEALGERRLLARKPDGDIAFELNLAASIIIGVLLTIFLFPVIIGIIIWSYTQKIQFEVIMDISDEEAEQLDNLETQNTIIGMSYDNADGEATLIQQT